MSELENAKKAFEQAKARLQAAKAKEASKERKQDTRRKVILGGLLLKKAETNIHFWQVLRTLITSIDREIDRKAFEGWQMPEQPTTHEPQQ